MTGSSSNRRLAWVTGANGFVGRHLCRLLESDGWAVYGIGRSAWPETDRREWYSGWWQQDAIEPGAFDSARRISGAPRVIFHLAGGASVGRSIEEPGADFKSTVNTTHVICDWVRRQAPKCTIVYASSAAVYGAGYGRPISTGDHVAPCSPYGTHKQVAESLGQCYRQVYGLDFRILRLFSVYGRHLRKQLIWDMVRRAAGGESPLLLGGSGQEVRDWVHVEDAARMLIRLAEIDNEIEADCIVNGAHGNILTVSDLADLVVRYLPKQTEVRFSGEMRAGDPTSLVADLPTNAASVLGAEPTRSVSEGISDQVEWILRDLAL